jgi:hypothetical protein
LDTTFERVLIDAQDTEACPTNPDGWDSKFGDNMCVYQCNGGYHRTLNNNVDMPPKYNIGDK